MATAASGIEQRLATKPVSVKKSLMIFVATLVVGAIGIAVANYNLDPMSYSRAAHREAAAAFEAGKSYAIYDPTIEYRGLRREHIGMMKTTPDLIYFSGSRFELVHKGMFRPDISFYNAFVQRDYADDVLAMAHLLDSHNRLPKNLVMSVRLFSFRPHDDRPEGSEWKMFVPEAAAMARRLESEPLSRIKYFPYAHWLNLFSIHKLTQQVKLRWGHDGPGIGPTDSHTLPNMEVLHADGSLSFSEKHRKSFTPEFARKDSERKAAADRSKPVKTPDRKQLEQFKSTLEFLVSKGVNVAILITPQHPAYWEGVVGSPYGKMLTDLEAEVRRIVTGAGAQFVGGFDPNEAKCPETAYRDFIHVENDCLKTIFDKVKLKI